MLKNASKPSLITVAIGIISIGTIVSFQSCKKWPAVPTVTTSDISSITTDSALSGGIVIDDNGAEVTSRGICWAAIRNPVIGYSSKTSDGTGTGTFTSELHGLTPRTTYYVRAYATNSEGISYGEEVSFITSPPGLATVTTNDFSIISRTSAWSGGLVTSDGGAHVSYTGVCWSTSENPTTSDNKTIDGIVYMHGYNFEEYLFGDYNSLISPLDPNTTYYVRAYAVNAVGTAYGDQKSFTTLVTENPIIFNPDKTYGSVTDIEENAYKTVQIGTQTWMAQNLRVTKFSDGTLIQNATDNLTWSELSGLTTPAYCWYNNDKEFGENYGAIYNWYAVGTSANGGKNICPDGWHVPTQDEMSTLVTFLGGEDVAGGKLKETGNTHWMLPNSGATNSSGFTALPAGYRWPTRLGRDFAGMHGGTHFWSSSIYTSKPKYSYYLSGIIGPVESIYYSWSDWSHGFSVRCVKDNTP